MEGYTLPLIFQPGDAWAYGVGVDWAGFVLEELTGQTLEDYMLENIWKPSGMHSTTFYVNVRTNLANRKATIGIRAVPGAVLTAGHEPLPDRPQKCSGGSGLYSTANDYSRFLSTLLQGNLLTTEMVNELFSPQLSDTTVLSAIFDSPFHDALCPEYPVNLPVNYSLGGALNLEDIPGKRKKGSLMWSGMSNTHWWIDREAGVTGVLFVQVLPPGDAAVKQLYGEVESAVYQELI